MNVPITERPVASRVSYSRGDLAAVRLGGFAAVVGGVLMMVHEVADWVIGGRTSDAPRSLLHTAWLAALVLAVRGVGVLQRPGLDRIGRIMIRLALVGVAAQTVLAAVETVGLLINPNGSGEPPPPIQAVLIAVLIGVLVALVVGLLAFAVSIVRAGVLPRSVGLILLAGVLTKMIAPDPPVPSLAIFGLTVVWLGVATVRRLSSDEVR